MPTFVTKSTRRPGKPLIEYGRGTENLYKRVGKIQTFTIMLFKKILNLSLVLIFVFSEKHTFAQLQGSRKPFTLTFSENQTVTSSPTLDSYSSIRTSYTQGWDVGGYASDELIENGEFIEARVSYPIPVGNALIGLSDPNKLDFDKDMEFFFRATHTGQIWIYRYNKLNEHYDTGLEYTSDTKLQLLLENGSVHFFVDGRKVACYPTNFTSLRAKYCHYSYDSQINDFSIFTHLPSCALPSLQNYHPIASTVTNFNWGATGIWMDPSACNGFGYDKWDFYKLNNTIGWDILGRGEMVISNDSRISYNAAGNTIVGFSHGSSSSVIDIDCALESQNIANSNLRNLFFRINGTSVSGPFGPVHHTNKVELRNDVQNSQVHLFIDDIYIFSQDVSTLPPLNTLEFSIYNQPSGILNMTWSACCNSCNFVEGGRKAVSHENPSASVHPAGYLPFPNPFSTRITPGVEGLVQVVDLSGKVVLPSQKVLADEALDLSSLKTGMYLLEVREEGKDIRRHRIVKQ